MIPEHIKALAKAILDGDETAALVIFDAIQESRTRFEQKEEKRDLEWLMSVMKHSRKNHAKKFLEFAGIRTLEEAIGILPFAEHLAKFRKLGSSRVGSIVWTLRDQGLITQEAQMDFWNRFEAQKQAIYSGEDDYHP